MSPSYLIRCAVITTFGGVLGAQNLDYCPRNREVVLSTDFTTITPCNAQPINVAGGIFRFRNVTIPDGVTVRGVGSNPMIWIVTGDFVVNGQLHVNGGDGASVDTLNSANFPTAGGRGNCGGGNGGFGSPDTTASSLVGQAGFGPFQVPNRGGFGGLHTCLFRGRRGTGGGGGSFTTQGDPFYGTIAAQAFGYGGNDRQNVFLSPPGKPLFSDARRDNDFWGRAFNVNTFQWINGELTRFTGGQGGAGGGDKGPACVNPNWISDQKGGGGGGAGGALVIYALGKIKVGAKGKITSNGGNGGGGEPAGSNRNGGGGAGGAGGMVVLMTHSAIELQVHGGTYGQRDYDFSVSADGGIGIRGAFGGAFLTKYPARSVPETSGGFGGMGLVQFFAPPDPRNADGTNTILDDNIHFLRGQTRLRGPEKQAYLAWRGFPNQAGVWVDDSGRPTNIGANEGDIRPSPVLLPLIF